MLARLTRQQYLGLLPQALHRMSELTTPSSISTLARPDHSSKQPTSTHQTTTLLNETFQTTPQWPSVCLPRSVAQLSHVLPPASPRSPLVAASRPRNGGWTLSLRRCASLLALSGERESFEIVIRWSKCHGMLGSARGGRSREPGGSGRKHWLRDLVFSGHWEEQQDLW